MLVSCADMFWIILRADILVYTSIVVRRVTKVRSFVTTAEYASV